jgi:murein tripeptide amidase MpaA
MLEITNNKDKKNANKEIVYVLGRQHAGETPGSLVMEGFINTLLSNRVESCELRDRFIFKIIPMVNPDGVVVGNYRTNLSGNDVNRKWDFPNKTIHP